uniref:Uncharacterized protein n=1 Tax=Arundo donax TaxID=35708 RepID=A0A0A9FYA0_ARUDO
MSILIDFDPFSDALSFINFLCLISLVMGQY